MPEVIAGIALPEGRPGAAFEVAQTLDAAAAGFERTAGTVERALAMVPSWHGLAAIAYQDRCATYEQAATSAANALRSAAADVRRYGSLYDEAHARIERLQRAAEECLARIKVAEREAAEAAERERAARERAAEAATRSPLDGGYSLAEHADAVREADAAADDRRRYEAEAEAEREELERLQKEALEEHERIRQAGREAGVATQVAVEGMPRVVAPGAPPAGGRGGFEALDPFALSLTAGAKSIDALGGASRGAERAIGSLRAEARRNPRVSWGPGSEPPRTQRLAQSRSTAKMIGRFAKPLGPVGPALDLAANRAQGRSWGESAGRTAISGGMAGLGGFAAGAACGAVTFGLAAAACGAGGAVAGGIAGDWLGDQAFGDG